ncbi:MAG: hypothetical protein WBA45_10660 [Microthrixaceae bacterium]
MTRSTRQIITRSTKWWRVLGSLAAVAMLGWSLLWVVTMVARHTEEFDKSVPAAEATSLRVEIGAGTLEIVGNDTSMISVRATFTDGLFDSDHTETFDGNTFVVTSECAFSRGPLAGGPNGCAADYRIEVPSSLDVRVVATDTAVSLRGLAGKVDVRTSNNRISAEDLAGAVRLETSNDEIEAYRLGSGPVWMRTSNDRVTAQFSDSPDQVDVRTSNGSVSLMLPDTPAAFATDVSTSNGDTKTKIRTDPDSPRRIRVRTSNDDVSITYSTD